MKRFSHFRENLIIVDALSPKIVNAAKRPPKAITLYPTLV